MLFPGDASRQGRHAGRYDPTTTFGHKFIRAALVIVVLALLIWPFIEPLMLTMDTMSLTSSDLPAAIGQLRIVYVSDIHKGGLFTQNRLADLISRINACSADIVLLGGDYAQDSDTAVDFFRHMPRIHSRYGVYGVVGNHDRTIPENNLSQLRSAMIGAGVTPLVNSVSRVRIGASTICIAGIDDPVCGHADLKGVASQVTADEYVIFLSHNPVVIPDALRAVDASGRGNWFDLGLFGHTHGGQIASLERFVDNDGVPYEYTGGWLRRNRIDLLISRGVGTSKLPIRILCTPQMHLITVRSSK